MTQSMDVNSPMHKNFQKPLWEGMPTMPEAGHRRACIGLSSPDKPNLLEEDEMPSKETPHPN
jgi:hypothetical protein